MSNDWTEKEVGIIVDDYFNMLASELNGEKYNKAAHRSIILPMLGNRSEGSIEFKHQNISAVLAELGSPFINGYKPRYNYQQLLADKVFEYMSNNQQKLETQFDKFSNHVVSRPLMVDFDIVVDDEPIQTGLINEPEPSYKPIKINYLEREQNNRRLGEEGEQLIIDYERWRLIKEGKHNLADKIEWVSKEQGDGTGFDILSKNTNGTDRYIEVKTTKLRKETPIFLTRTEVSFAEMKSKEFYLYRIFNFDSYPQFFIKNGNYQNFCELRAETFMGIF